MSKYNNVPVELLIEVCFGDVSFGEKFIAGKLGTVKQELSEMKTHLEKVREKETQNDDLDLYLKVAPIHLNLIGLKLNQIMIKSNHDVFRLAQQMVFEI